MNTKKILGIVAVLALVAVAMVGAVSAANAESNPSGDDNTVTVTSEIGTVTGEYADIGTAFADIEAEEKKRYDAATAAGVKYTAVPYTIKVNATSGSTVTSIGFGNDGFTKMLNVTIDLNECDLKLTDAVGSAGTKTQGIRCLEGNVITIKDGSIGIQGNEGKSNIAWLINNYGTLTLQDVTLDVTNEFTRISGNTPVGQCVLATSCGVVTLDNVDIVANTKVHDGYTNKALIIGNSDSYSGYTQTENTVILKKGSTVSGLIDIEKPTGTGNKSVSITTDNIAGIDAKSVLMNNADIKFNATGDGLTLDDVIAKIQAGTVAGSYLSVNETEYKITSDVTTSGKVATELVQSKGTKVTLSVIPTYTFVVPATVSLNSETGSGHAVKGKELYVSVSSSVIQTAKKMVVDINTEGCNTDYKEFKLDGIDGNEAYYKVGKATEGDDPQVTTDYYSGKNGSAKQVISVNIDDTKAHKQNIFFETVSFTGADSYSNTLDFQFHVDKRTA